MIGNSEEKIVFTLGCVLWVFIFEPENTLPFPYFYINAFVIFWIIIWEYKVFLLNKIRHNLSLGYKLCVHSNEFETS